MNRRILDDDQIDSFLKKNQPVAPAIDEKKMHSSLLAKLGFTQVVSTPKSRVRTTWVAFSGALAAGVVAFMVMSKPMNGVVPSAVAPVASSEEWDEELFAEELPAMEVGEDYMELMAQNDVAGRVSK